MIIIPGISLYRRSLNRSSTEYGNNRHANKVLSYDNYFHLSILRHGFMWKLRYPGTVKWTIASVSRKVIIWSKTFDYINYNFSPDSNVALRSRRTKLDWVVSNDLAMIGRAITSNTPALWTQISLVSGLWMKTWQINPSSAISVVLHDAGST